MPSDYEQIRKDNIKEFGEGEEHLKLLGKMYSEPTHFIFELLQNAEDAEATKIIFSLSGDMLKVKHNGRLFNDSDVRGVCSIGKGTKAKDLKKIGKFGIGFKSVYAYTDTPKIHSGDEHFRIENYIRPYSEDPKEIESPWTTLFCFPFNKPDVSAIRAEEEISKRLCNLSARTLLFLHKINEIEYSLPDGTYGVYMREEYFLKHGKKITVMGKNGDQEEEENWLVFENPVDVQNSNNLVQVEIAFKLDIDKKNKECITRIKNAQLVVYFPTEKETYLGFLIQGPYSTTPARDNISSATPEDKDWNEQLVAATAALLREALLHIKEMGLLTISLLESMPIRIEENFSEDNDFFPIVDAVRNAFMEEELLPADDGTFVIAEKAKLARGGKLLDILSNDQLSDLCQSGSKAKWLTKDITQAPYLRKYLIDKLDIEEIKPEMFFRKLSEADSFLVEQPDKWLLKFYEYLSEHTREIYMLRDTPIIRLQDGSQVKPFQEDGTPNAYLQDEPRAETSLSIVKIEIFQDKKSREFLKLLGIPEFDIVEEVIKNILPKYAKKSSVIFVDEHERDIAAIEKAYATDSQEKRVRLKEKLRETSFVCVESQNQSIPIYKNPKELYFMTNKLRLYFSNSSASRFASIKYSSSIGKVLKDLGVKDTVRIKTREKDGGGFVIIKNYRGYHVRGINNFDPDIDIEGLDFSLDEPTPEKSEFIWNTIAVKHSDCIRGFVETFSRQTYEHKYLTGKEEKISKFGELLINTAWLPAPDGSLKKPCDLAVDDLPKSFIRDEKLIRKLGMKMNVIPQRLKEMNIREEWIPIMQQYDPLDFEKLMEELIEQKKNSGFPEDPSSNSKRRERKMEEQVANAPHKIYKQTSTSKRATRELIEVERYLREKYSNEDDQMICQICKKEMPFKKRDGKYYFEAVEALSRDYFLKENEAQFLALCPLCAARYKEFVKKDEKKMRYLKDQLMSTNDLEIKLGLGELDTSIRFVETHYHDIKVIIKSS